jgi:hypothetical protein
VAGEGGRDEALAAVVERLERQEDHLSGYLQLLEEHRNDYTETISRLSAAGRQTRTSQQEVQEQLLSLTEARAASEEELSALVKLCEEDRAQLSKLSKDSTRLFGSIADCQKGLALKKNKKRGTDDDAEKCVVDASQLQEMTALKDRMDIFEESVIDTVNEMVESHQLEALAPLEKRLRAVEVRQDKYCDLVKDSVDTFHSAEIIPIVSSVHKVERLVESMTSKLELAQRGRDSAGTGGTTRTRTKSEMELPPPPPRAASSTPSPSRTDFPPARTRHSFSSDQLSSSSTLIFQHSHGPSVAFSSPPGRSSSSSSSSGSSSQPAFTGNLHADTMREKKTAPPDTDPGINLGPPSSSSPSSSVVPDVTHKPKSHPPQSFNLTNTLSSAHEIMPSTGIPNLSTLPDLRKAHKEGRTHKQSGDSQIQEEITSSNITTNHNNISNSNIKNKNNISNNYNSPSAAPSSSAAAASPASPAAGVQQTEVLLKTLQDKKQKHRKKFQLMVKSEM